MIPQSFKIYTLNTASMLISFSNLEQTLKITLLTVSIVYTLIQTIKLLNKKDDTNK
jgi:uncharacterized paraquat-inducible protein A